MIKIIACDLDETLLRTENRDVSDEDKKSIAQLKEIGVKFVLASGRPYNSMDGTLKELGLFDEAEQYVISYNGGAITENKGNKLLHFEGISFKLAEEFYRRGQDYDVCIHVYTKDTVYAYNLFKGEKDYLNGRMAVTEVFDKNLDFLKGQEILKCLYTNTDHEYLKKIADDLKDITADVDVSYSANRYLEFNKRGVNKGAGLRRLAEMLGVDMQDTMAIGDNLNDLSMIKAAGIGVGVANVVEEMKGDCDYICRATCDESAVSEAIKKFVLI